MDAGLVQLVLRRCRLPHQADVLAGHVARLLYHGFCPQRDAEVYVLGRTVPRRDDMCQLPCRVVPTKPISDIMSQLPGRKFSDERGRDNVRRRLRRGKIFRYWRRGVRRLPRGPCFLCSGFNLHSLRGGVLLQYNWCRVLQRLRTGHITTCDRSI
jgi:hypothetical protein